MIRDEKKNFIFSFCFDLVKIFNGEQNKRKITGKRRSKKKKEIYLYINKRFSHETKISKTAAYYIRKLFSFSYYYYYFCISCVLHSHTHITSFISFEREQIKSCLIGTWINGTVSGNICRLLYNVLFLYFFFLLLSFISLIPLVSGGNYVSRVTKKHHSVLLLYDGFQIIGR